MEIDSVVQELWNEFILKERPLDLRRRLIIHYIWLVKYVIQTMNLPINSILSDSDFVNIGILGLHEAIERFEPERGVKFESYSIPRIKGTIQDELRRLDWLSRTARKKAHEFVQAGDDLRSKEGREVSVEEIRTKLKVTEEEYQSYLEAAAAAKASMYLSESTQAMLEDQDMLEELPDTGQDNIQLRMEQEERVNFIINYIKILNERKRLVMTLYYYESMTFKEIGNVMDVSESRICQIHTQVVNDLRDKLKEFDNA